MSCHCRCFILYFTTVPDSFGGTRWRSWLWHCATSRKFSGSIPDGVIGIFHWHNTSGRNMALRFTHPLTEMSARNILWELKWPVRRADNLTTFMCWLSWNPGTSTSWNPQSLSRHVMGLLFHYRIVFTGFGFRIVMMHLHSRYFSVLRYHHCHVIRVNVAWRTINYHRCHLLRVTRQDCYCLHGCHLLRVTQHDDH
jgi:hypothetical protein